jgi:hypothetical protein
VFLGPPSSARQLRRFENYTAEIFTAFGLDLNTPATRDTPRRFIRALLDVTGGYDGDPKLVKAFETGGPHLLGDFFAESCVDEQFLTLAPRVAGRDGSGERPGLVAGRVFAPGHPLWGTLVSVKRGGHHLFLRYAFSTSDDRSR